MYEKMTEQEMRDTEVPRANTIGELSDYIESLVQQEHDYGTCVYAMSMAATAAFNYVARRLGVTGFQASCADMDVLRRTRRISCSAWQWGRPRWWWCCAASKARPACN